MQTRWDEALTHTTMWKELNNRVSVESNQIQLMSACDSTDMESLEEANYQNKKQTTRT